jgi:hypothetical protein
MARVLGETAGYVTNQSVKKFQKMLLYIFFTFYIFAFAIGLTAGMNKQPYSLIAIIILTIAIPLSIWLLNRISGKLAKETINFRKGATGEAVVGHILEDLPDGYRIIHDLQTSFGNIDHVVIGPSGTFVIDTKNWRGLVTSNGNGELLLNGKPTEKTEVKNLVKSIMKIKKKMGVLCSIDRYIEGVLAFPSAYVEAKWGTTGNVCCVTTEKLNDYITENKRHKLSGKEIDSISKAFFALARMDKDFKQWDDGLVETRGHNPVDMVVK